MNKPVTLCDHCDMRARCLLNYDGVLCQKNRSVEPTNADRIRAMSDEAGKSLSITGLLGCSCLPAHSSGKEKENARTGTDGKD